MVFQEKGEKTCCESEMVEKDCRETYDQIFKFSIEQGEREIVGTVMNKNNMMEGNSIIKQCKKLEVAPALLENHLLL